MPGPIPRPRDMRDNLHRYNWRLGYGTIAIAGAVLSLGAVWVIYKRNRYDRFFEKVRDPEYKRWILEHTALTPDKYSALIKRLQGEMAEVREKYEN